MRSSKLFSRCFHVITSAYISCKRDIACITMYSPSPFGSPFNKGLPDLKSAKKKQSVIKTVTANFAKLMISWRQDVSQIEVLLSNLQNLISNLESIQRIECRQPQAFPIFVKLFPDVYSLLTGKIYGEVEAVYHQLKSYM